MAPSGRPRTSTPETSFTEPGSAPSVPAARPKVDQPQAPSGKDWKAPKYTISGYATFYDNGTTAMRLPRGTVVRICGDGGCIERIVNDYGPQKTIRIVDLYRPDFFEICGCVVVRGHDLGDGLGLLIAGPRHVPAR